MFKKYFTLILTILVINLSLVTTAFSSRKKDEETKFVASRFELKLEKTFSFNDEKIDHVYHREGYRGNMPISPDSEYFLGKINDSTLYLLNLNSGDTRRVAISHKFEYALFSKDRKRVCLYEFQDKTASVLDLESGRILSTINSPEKIDEASISPDGERITTGRREVKLI
jgi:WD40 repeat protein